MIRCCSKFFIPLPYRSGSPVCLSRVYVASIPKDTTQRRYASGEARPPRRLRKVFYATVGLTLIGVGGAVVYAKQDPAFRNTLESYAPGTDRFISIIYQEKGETLSVDAISEQLTSLQDKLLSLPNEVYKLISPEEEASKPTTLPLPKAKEVKSVDEAKAKPKAAVATTKKAPAVVEVSNEAIESNIKNFGNEALQMYNDAIALIQSSGSEIIELIDKSVENVDQKAWNEIRKQVEENKKTLLVVEEKAKIAGEKVKQFTSLLKSTKLSEDSVEQLKGLEIDVNKAKAKLEDLKNSRLGASTKYFNKIEEARKHFSEELVTLFPSIRLSDKYLKLSEDQIDLFLYYAVQKLLYYQKELNKLETLTSQRLKKAIQDSKDDASIIQETIDAEVDKAKRQIKEDFDKKVLELKGECDKEIHNQMKRQEQVHIDLLNDQLKLKEKEVERKLIQRLEDRVLEEQGRLQAELADMTGRMKGLNEAISKRALQDQKAQTSQALWSATEALYAQLKNSSPDKDAADKLQPLTNSVDAIRNAAAKGDDLVETVLATIPSTALKRGVYPEDSLRDRFLKVEKVAWRVAGIPEGGASLPKLLLAWLQSALIIKASEPIPTGELNNEPFDPAELNNYDVLQRARYYVDRGDFEQALKYMNLLKGGARSIALDWMREVTILLETQQAANLLLAHASASGMIYS
ncbi:MICOS complex subunit Mic60 isoform X2 [Homalodisca vitripennis]|uniref:MICOS complex subunit Mic60 isoform X2 n=1 Tax=Homalodisca vitripennis TaxID=197043 RepID=UPI001EEC4857|nr:MICOS complex subunit Mic60 isoform X2 [Homalodisca vitripennis]